MFKYMEEPYKFVKATLLLLSCILLGLNFLIGVMIIQETAQVLQDFVFSMEVQCTDLRLSPYEDTDIFRGVRVSVNDAGICVCKDKNVLKIIDLMVEQHARIRLSQGLVQGLFLACGNESLRLASGQHTAYFTKTFQRQQYTDSVFEQAVEWDTNTQRSYVDEDIKYQNGEIKIQRGGVYVVYASLTFNFTKEKTPDMKRRPTKTCLRICKRTYDFERTLAGKSEMYRSRPDDMVTSLSVTSHVVLQRDDAVYVKVCDRKKVAVDSNGNSFGLFPL